MAASAPSTSPVKISATGLIDLSSFWATMPFILNAIALRMAGRAGIGVKIPLASARVALSFEIVDHVTRSPLRANDDRVLLDTGELRVRNRAHPMAADTNVHYAHAIGVAAGLTFSLGRDAPQ